MLRCLILLVLLTGCAKKISQPLPSRFNVGDQVSINGTTFSGKISESERIMLEKEFKWQYKVEIGNSTMTYDEDNLSLIESSMPPTFRRGDKVNVLNSNNVGIVLNSPTNKYGEWTYKVLLADCELTFNQKQLVLINHMNWDLPQAEISNNP